MPLKNTAERYGLVAVSLHWLIAATVIGLFALGLWMTDLSYYSPYYHGAPFWHKSIGISLTLALLIRILWRGINRPPPPLPNHARWERIAARTTHLLLYVLLLVILGSGYLISTANGDSVSVFGWFELPAVVSGLPDQADRAGQVHYWVAMSLIGLASVHALAALKHHFIDRDTTLLRMLGRAKPRLQSGREKATLDASPTRER